MKKLIHIIKNKNWQKILKYSKSLSDSDRFSTIKALQEIDIDKNILKKDGFNLTGTKRTEFYDNRRQIEACLNYFLITCTRNYDDLKKLEIQHEYGTLSPFYSYISTNNSEPLIAFYTLFPPDYFDKVVKEISRERFRTIHFKILWKLYENNWITFDEEYFVRSLLVIPMFDRSTADDAEFLFENIEALENVFLKFHKYEMPILDISKWQSREGFVCKKVYEFWTEVIIILQEKGYVFDRTIVTSLLESLLNNWKRPHLDWHVRLLKIFKPTTDEYIQNQSILFSILGTGQPGLINYSMQTLKSIHKHEGFDSALFIKSFPILFSNEKISKSILIGLNIIEFFFSQSVIVEIDYRENLGILLMQVDTKIQEKVAHILVAYFNDAGLKQSIEPYASYLKQKAKEILEVNNEIGVSNIDTEIEEKFEPIKPITNWDELLLHIGTCIRTQTATDIDVLYEGLNKLQFEIPSDFEKQLKPYTKQLFNRFWESQTMQIFSMFMASWINKGKLGISTKDYNPIPFFVRKTVLLLNKLKNKNSLPFLSTPTHEPFYVHPSILLDNLYTYETSKTEVDLEDLIVACNRILISEINKEATEKSKKLSGYYSGAIQYLYGVTDTIKYTESTLPLWTQVTRMKNPDGIFTEFENSKVSNYPTIVKPFYIEYDIKMDANKYATWYFLMLEHNWNYSWHNKEKSRKCDHIYYNVASASNASRVDIAYQLSLNPHYLDGQLCRYIPDTASGNEVDEFEDCLYPIQFVLENQLRIYHSGWLYIAVCLLFEKKITRDLASEYIHLAISRKENLNVLATAIGRLISLKYAPANRLIEYLDKPNNIVEIRQFQHQVLSSCILSFDNDSLPRNSKKIIQYYKEWLNVLKLDLPDAIEEKLAQLKK